MNLRIASSVFVLALAAGACTANITGPSAGSGAKPGEPGYVPPGMGGPGLTGGGAGSAGMSSTGTPSGSGTTGIVGVTDPGTPADPNAAGPMPLRRLTHREYNNTVRDLLGVTTNPADAFPLDLDNGFLFHRAGLVSTLDASTLRDAAEALVKTLDITKLLPCSPTTGGEDACLASFITTFGAQAFRRPVAADEAARLTALFKTARTTLMLDFNESIRLLVEAIVQSPEFLYHWQLGNSAPTLEGQVAKLTPYEVASRLSYFFWRSMPDKTLFDAAAAGMLKDPTAVTAQAQRLLADPKAKATVSAFFDEWLGLEELPERPKDASVYPQFGEPLANAMLDENHAFISGVLFGATPTFTALMNGTSVTLSAAVAPIYGAQAGAMSLDPTQRAGLLTRAGFLTLTGSPTGSHPVKRGRKVYERFLCGTLPPPPNNVPPTKPASAGGTTRQRFEEHDKNPCAQGCHTIMDPLGFPFEHYDGLGQYRTMDNGLPVDSSTTLTLDGASHTVADAIELSKLLADSPTAQNCFAAQWARFALVRDAVEADRYSIQTSQTAFSKAGLKVPDMLVSLATSRSFLYRSLADGEVTQ